MTAWAETTLLTGEGDKPGTMLAWSVAAVGAADAGEAEVQVAATKEPADHFADDRSPRTVALA